jgi:hypothetical protein
MPSKLFLSIYEISFSVLFPFNLKTYNGKYSRFKIPIIFIQSSILHPLLLYNEKYKKLLSSIFFYLVFIELCL